MSKNYKKQDNRDWKQWLYNNPTDDDYCDDCSSIKKDNNLCDEHYDILERE
jgi:hypothetical protein